MKSSLVTYFTSWWTSQKERHLTVSNGLLGQIVIEDDSVTAVISEPFTHGATRVWSQVLKWSSVCSSSNDDDGVFHGVVSFQTGDKLRNSRLFLTNSNVDAVPKWETINSIRILYSIIYTANIIIVIIIMVIFLLIIYSQFLGFIITRVPAGLVQHSVQSDGGFTSLTITNDQFTLTTTNWDKGVNSLQTSLHRFVDGLTGNDT